MSEHRHWRTEANFYPKAQKLREIFDSRFAEPRETHNHRFVWDYWHVPDQYNLVRTSAEHFFGEELFEDFTQSLLNFGQKHLGCHELTPPWLSYYVEGCEQKVHADNPHGPWAYVFSLTPWQERQFSGGETFIYRPEALNYWQMPQKEGGLEKSDLMIEIPAEFNQLTLFDPRLPHGVNEVKGTKDPRQARLVVHGWFTTPGPYIDGPLEGDNVEEVFHQHLNPLFDEVETWGSYSGTLTFKIKVKATGQVQEAKTLTHTLIALDSESDDSMKVSDRIGQALLKLNFKPSQQDSEITLPFIFE